MNSLDLPRYRESPVLIACAGETLPGIVSHPHTGATRGEVSDAASDVGVLILVGGPQYRAGSHRQFVLLARHLAGHGHAVLRFDRRGMGDAGGAGVPFDAAQADIAAAVQALRQAAPQVRRIVLWGLCDGASAALLYWLHSADASIAGLALVNPWVRSAATQARTRVKHYYLKRLGQAAFWRKLFAGEVKGMRAATELAGNLAGAVTRDESAQSGAGWLGEMAQALTQFPGPVLLVLSGQDYTAREFVEWTRAVPALRGFDHGTRVTRCDVPAADHTFSTALWRAEVERATLAWLTRVGARA